MDGIVTVFNVSNSSKLHTFKAGMLFYYFFFFKKKKQKRKHTHTRIKNKTGHSMPIRSLRFSNDNSLIIAASDDMQVHLFDLSGNSSSDPLGAHSSWVLSVSVSSNSNFFATA